MKKIQTKNLFKNLKRHDATFLDIGPLVKKAIGSKVVDMDGKSFIDFTSGILFANIGHSNKHVINNVVLK